MADPAAAVAWPVRTERLLLRRATAGDVRATWEHRKLPVVQQWIGLAPQTYEDYREAFLEPDRLASLVVVEREGEVIGDLVLRVGDGWAQRESVDAARGTQAEIGWSFHPAAGGQGYATEAVGALVALCFGPLGLRRVYAGCFADNERSWRLMERIGMRREEHSLATRLHRDGRWLDWMTYGLLAREWPGSG